MRFWSRSVRVGLVVVRGRSMEPTLRDGDRLLARYDVLPVVGDIAVVRFADGVVAVKRVQTVDAGGWLVTRDNPTQGRDSWTLGGEAILRSGVLATVVGRVWPRPGRLRGPVLPRTQQDQDGGLAG